MGIFESLAAARAGTFQDRQAAALKISARLALYLLVVGLSVLFMFPFFWTISSSLKAMYEMFSFPPMMFPAKIQWANYREVVTKAPYGRWVWNSTILVILATSGQVLTASVVAYSFARFRWPGREVFFLLTLGTMMIPGWVTLIPQYLMFRQLRWLDSIKPLWVPTWFGGGAFYIFLIRQFMMSLPREMDEAAEIDGAGPPRILWTIILPLSRPALATAAVISAIAHWDNFMGPLIYINSKDKLVLSVGLRWFREWGIGGSPYLPKDHILMAACVLATIPPILLFFLAQRYFVRGVVLSGIKG